MTVGACRKRLATLWFGAGGALSLLLIAQTILGRYGDKASDVWGWFLPTVMPTLSLVIGVVASRSRDSSKPADAFVFGLAFAISLLYLASVSLVFLLQPFVKRSPLDTIKETSLWLGPFQGLVAAAMGRFFTKGTEATKSAATGAKDVEGPSPGAGV
jgi:hypothetical protein